jgi:hypothetical protein
MAGQEEIAYGGVHLGSKALSSAGQTETKERPLLKASQYSPKQESI